MTRKFNTVSHPVGRKQHRCEYCYGPIPLNEKHVQFVGAFEGEFQSWRMHAECYTDYDNSGDDCFMPGEAPWPMRISLLVKMDGVE